MFDEHFIFKYVVLLCVLKITTAQILYVIAIIFCIKKKSIRRQIPSKMTEHRERVRDELMKHIVGNDQCQDIICIGPQAFLNLCTVLRD